MTHCTRCNRSGRPTLYRERNGWCGCLQLDEHNHVAIARQYTQMDARKWLEDEAGRRFEAWDVVQGEDEVQLELWK